jgi:glycosyltransferase involved in cell wall biosynthesis
LRFDEYSKLKNKIKKLLNQNKKVIDVINVHDHECEKSILILIDSTWNKEILNSIDIYRSKGGKVCAVLYDLIPFSHPETVEENTIIAYKSFWSQAHQHLDAVMCISKSVKFEYIQWLTLNGCSNSIPENKVGYFYLGANFEGKDKFVKILKEGVPFYLMVGSLEPRKNHATVIDAFEKLWQEKINIRLVIVGAYGWKSENLKVRILDHNEFGKNLFFINDANDREVASLYRNSSAIIMASIAEGFGLPIIEAASYGKKIYCSDIPIFREISTSNTIFFPPMCSKKLTELIRSDLIDLKQKEEARNVAFDWIDWRSSTRQLCHNLFNIINCRDF